jgi:hypothetical protein
MAQGDEAAALERYQWGVAHGTGIQPGFLRLAEVYGPAKDALLKHWHRLAAQIVEFGVDDSAPEWLATFAQLSFYLRKEPALMTIYARICERLPVTADIRRALWTAIETELVKERRYLDAVREHDLVVALMRHQLGALKSVTPEDEEKHSILRVTGEHAADKFAVHVEALVGSKQDALAKEFAEEMVQLRPRPSTFAHLRRSARRARGSQFDEWLRRRAQELLSPADYAVFLRLSAESPPRNEETDR